MIVKGEATREVKGEERVMEGVQSNYITHIYGNVVMKPLCAI
jgi:hypothetical protein